MKLLLVIVGLFAAAFAVGPPTSTCIDRSASCLEAAGKVSIPEDDIGLTIPVFGPVSLAVGPVLDCTALSTHFRLATEKSYTETTSGGVVSFQLELEVAMAIDLTLDTGLTVYNVVNIDIGADLCVFGYVDVVFTINIEGTYSAGGNPADSVITSVNLSGTRASDWITCGGNTAVGTAVTILRNDILNNAFTDTITTADSLLKRCLL